jgi:hypothetical protein
LEIRSIEANGKAETFSVQKNALEESQKINRDLVALFVDKRRAFSYRSKIGEFPAILANLAAPVPNSANALPTDLVRDFLLRQRLCPLI